jgi:hypothetical protein
MQSFFDCPFYCDPRSFHPHFPQKLHIDPALSLPAQRAGLSFFASGDI